MPYDVIAEMRLEELQEQAQPKKGISGFFAGIPQINLMMILGALLAMIWFTFEETGQRFFWIFISLIGWIWLAKQEQKGMQVIDNRNFMFFAKQEINDMINDGDLSRGNVQINATKLRHHNAEAWEKSIGYKIREYDGEITQGFLTFAPTLDSGLNKPLTRDFVPTEYLFNPLERMFANTWEVMPSEIKAQKKFEDFMETGKRGGRI